ncbi:MAG: HAMP domain-containing histidine kinase [Clostridiales bacterium]|nr:HAMP domain-containing histidine kinase [Clostridiales bacterium]
MKKVKKTRSLVVKILVSVIALLVGTLFIFNMIGVFVLGDMDGKIEINPTVLVGTFSMIVLATIFIVIIYNVLLKRIEALNEAVKKVSHGDYTVTVSDKGNDELSLLGENFNKMAKELAANAMLSKDFISYVSHELKTPLSVVRTHAEALLDDCEADERNAYASVIIGEADKLNEMSKNIITLCKLDSSGLLPMDDVFSPAEQIKSFVLATQDKPAAKKLNIELDVESFDIRGNAALTYLVWQNLIANAYKFTEQNGNVKISLTKEDGEIHFTVTDDGVGITDEDKQKIFTLFFVGNRSRNSEGSGIGLYLTKVVVEKLGGVISFLSTKGQGSTFSVALPIMDA